MRTEVTPPDTRYVPFTQQPECCVPTSISMIMYRNDIPLIPFEELGYHLGLTVPTREKDLFYKAVALDEPPTASGYGTQISNPEYEPNTVFKRLGIPLSFTQILADDIRDSDHLLKLLRAVEDEDRDALLCFNHGVVRGEYKPFSGHVAVFDRVVNGQIRLVDASPKQPKWRLLEPELMFEAIQKHGLKNAGGIWYFDRA